MYLISGEKFKTLRKQMGLTLDEVGRLVGLSGSTIGLFERGGDSKPATVAKVEQFYREHAPATYAEAVARVEPTNLSEAITLALTRHKLTQTQFADWCGVGDGSVSTARRGLGTLSAPVARKILRVLGILHINIIETLPTDTHVREQELFPREQEMSAPAGENPNAAEILTATAAEHTQDLSVEAQRLNQLKILQQITENIKQQVEDLRRK